MIQANELRIGNKVMFKGDAGTYTVLGVPAWGMDGNGDGKEPLILIDRCHKQIVPESKLRPIPISPEILEKAGFSNQKLDDWEVFAYEDTPICAHWDGVEWCFKYGYDSDLTFAACEFVHQLQNLIFALTNKDIILKF